MLLIWLLLVLVLCGRRSGGSLRYGSGPGRKRIRLNRKTPAHLAGFMIQSRPRVWKRLRHVGHSCVSIPGHKRRRGDQDYCCSDPAQVRTGVGNSLGFVQAHVSRFARAQLVCSCLPA